MVLETEAVERRIPMTREEWSKRLNAFLQLNKMGILEGAGKVITAIAKAFAESEYDKYRIKQDRLYQNDFHKLIEEMEKKMGENPKVILKILFISIIGIWVLSKVSFQSNIDQTIIAKVYEDGASVQNTSVIIKGSRSNYLFSNSQYYDGRFIVDYYERSGREEMKASITWNKEYIEQSILYYQNGTFPMLEINSKLLINKEMDEFALGIQDGIIIATSDEMYRDYTEKIHQ